MRYLSISAGLAALITFSFFINTAKADPTQVFAGEYCGSFTGSCLYQSVAGNIDGTSWNCYLNDALVDRCNIPAGPTPEDSASLNRYDYTTLTDYLTYQSPYSSVNLSYGGTLQTLSVASPFTDNGWGFGANCTLSDEANAADPLYSAIGPRGYVFTDNGMTQDGFRIFGDLRRTFYSAGPYHSTVTYHFQCTNIYGQGNDAVGIVNVCPASTPIWNGSACVPSQPLSASITINGQQNVTLNVGDANTKAWNSTGGTSWVTTYRVSNGTCAAAGQSGTWANGNSASGSVQSNANQIYAGCTVTFTYTVSNAGGSTTATASMTVNSQTPSGSIMPNSCTIAVGASSCEMTVAWQSSNTIGTVTVQRPYANNSVFATGTSGSQPATFTPPGSYQLDLYDGAIKLGSGTFTASCASGTVWDGSACRTASSPPAAPTNAQYSCSADGSHVTVSWTPASGATAYYPRFYAPTASQCTSFGWQVWSDGKTCLPNPDGISGTSVANFPVTPGTTYTWYVFSGNSSGVNWNQALSQNFTCTASSCGNGATDPFACKTCPTGSVLVNGTCVTATCTNGGVPLSQCTTEASLTASPSTITLGQSSVLTWSSTNATSCTSFGGFSTGDTASGSATVRPSSTTSYGITCTGAGGTSAPAYATVNVVQPIATISASPIRVLYGSPTTITWNSSDVTSCAVSGPGLTTTGKSGTRTVNVYSQSTYTITCQTVGSPITQSTVVNIAPVFNEF